MIPEQQPTGRALQANRHLRERNAQLVLETKTRYLVASKHLGEQSGLSLAGAGLEPQAALKLRQPQEVEELKQQNRQNRLALQQRHLQEQADCTPPTAGRGRASQQQ